MLPTTATDSSQLRPLLNNNSNDDGNDINKESIYHRLRKCAFICQPITLLLILIVCIIAYIHPFWNDFHIFSSTASSEPFLTTDHSHSSPIGNNKNKKLIETQQLSSLVTSLPGLLNDGTVSFEHYSGYVTALDGRELHYWYFEAVNNPDTAPLYFWTNGGPGCSGLTGLLTEHGPFWAVDDGETLLPNPYSWNQEVNMVYFEQPYGVGFSTVADDKSYVSGDDAAVSDFDAAIRSFITKYPQFEDRDVYLSSESYGGHYMPLTSLKILENNDAGTLPYVNLKGFMVGNPYTNYDENSIGAMEAYYGHGLMREKLYEVWKENCYDADAMETPHCIYLRTLGYYEASTNLDYYALDFDYCGADESWNKHNKIANKLSLRPINRILNRLRTDKEWNEYNEKHIKPLFLKNRLNSRRNIKKLPTRNEILNFKHRVEGSKEKRRRLEIATGFSYFPCAAEYMTTYLNREDVQTALHVSATEWDMCSDDVFENWPEFDWDNPMQPYYDELVKNYDLKIMIFSGDDDSVCGTHGTQYWLDGMNGDYGWYVDDNDDWTAWDVEDQLAGFSTTYLDEDGNVALYFHTIRTAGHMVPQTQPQRALALLKKYLYELD